MLDGAFIANRIISCAKINIKEILFYNVEFEKAFDLVDWGYLMDILKAMGFQVDGEDEFKLACLHLSSYHVLIKDSATKEFRMRREL